MMAPCGNPTKASRFGLDPDAVLAHAVAAGFIASRSGSAIVAPTPFNTARREMCFWDKYMSDLRQIADRDTLELRPTAKPPLYCWPAPEARSPGGPGKG